ncbi:glycoside hydrolase family 127 protein [Scatolibacter rhodanostii]|uniref:glycoside hydrolase family 127 protein n=1 Tax=Scatolibacter rhodanostii TaxID=2014781 RepID=UPI000C0688D1|nr:beta-L-arabinofuranosidase domain-containing protein [Scatolibacter rhodanostii]
MNEILKKFTVTDPFFGRYESLVNNVVIPYQEKALKDEIPGAEKSHAVENFRLAAEVIETGKNSAEFYGMVFQDSDLAKWLEATAYSIQMSPNEALEKSCDEIIDLIGRAQHKDGYLNTYFTAKDPARRWTNLAEAHELYCAGHMMEAAVAYAECTGKTKLLDIMCGMADHIYERFIVQKTPGYPGHPEIELALMRMYRCTGNEKYLELAKHFVDVRGVDADYFLEEQKVKGWTVWNNNCADREYTQNHVPVREQTEAVGHSVRAVYLYTGMADVAATTQDESLKLACQRLWKNIVERRMYVTGSIGSSYEGEAFTKDFHLPNDTAYAETCASIGLIFFARKMIDLEKKSEYADIMERALYNGVLAGMQLDGKRFFYVNPLEVLPGISGKAITHRHTLPERPKWFACACCPPNVARLLPSIGSYAWSEEGSTVYSHLFIGGMLDLTDTLQGKIKVETNYPYDGKVVYRFEPTQDKMDLTLAIRMPFWSADTSILLNGEEAKFEIRDGYAYLNKAFMAEDEIAVHFDMSVKKVYARNNVSADSGKTAFLRGPLVYCAEGTDNDGDVLGLRVKKESAVTIGEYQADCLEGIVPIEVEGYRMKDQDNLYSFERPQAEACSIHLIPYYAWGNRGLNSMRVWMPEME